ncbi:MAG: helix-turn-helix transcriptional regulator [Oscillospiraceae bacterium]|nr:helix-turn-helix transcriptional regulator [Oscillospiraceae bacterium]
MDGLKDIRRQRGLTQADLATMLGVTQSVVAMWERGAVLPSASKLPDIADALSCSIDALFCRDGPGQTSA